MARPSPKSREVGVSGRFWAFINFHLQTSASVQRYRESWEKSLVDHDFNIEKEPTCADADVLVKIVDPMCFPGFSGSDRQLIHRYRLCANHARRGPLTTPTSNKHRTSSPSILGRNNVEFQLHTNDSLNLWCEEFNEYDSVSSLQGLRNGSTAPKRRSREHWVDHRESLQ